MGRERSRLGDLNLVWYGRGALRSPEDAWKLDIVLQSSGTHSPAERHCKDHGAAIRRLVQGSRFRVNEACSRVRSAIWSATASEARRRFGWQGKEPRPFPCWRKEPKRHRRSAPSAQSGATRRKGQQTDPTLNERELRKKSPSTRMITDSESDTRGPCMRRSHFVRHRRTCL